MDHRHDRLPSAAEIAEINAKHLIETPLAPADLLFVFGTRLDEGLRAAEACRLWRERLFVSMSKLAVKATDFFHIPTNRVVELGTQVEL